MAKNKKTVRKQKTHRLSWYTWLLMFVDVCALVCFFVAYGPYSQVRDWLVTTALQTGTHKYFAYVLYNESMVKEILAKNKTTETNEATDASAIKFVENPDTGYYANEFEKMILQHEEGAEYKILPIKENGYSGFMVVVYDPSRLDLVLTNSRYGEFMSDFASRVNAEIAVNGGGTYYFLESNALKGIGSAIVDGKLERNRGFVEPFVGMTYDNILVLKRCTANDAMALNYRWATVFSPYLIVNGEKSKFSGNGGYGYQPRTAIGQRKDGVMLLAVIDGRGSNGSQGASMVQLADLFEKYGAYNAANLDGGGSTMLYEKGKIVNEPRGWGYTGERHIGEAIILRYPSGD